MTNNKIIEQNQEISVNGFIWKKKEYLEYFANGIAQRFKLNPYISKILASRFKTFEEIALFLKPMLCEQMPNPMHLKGMSEVLIRIFKALENNEKIAIFGDYDVDGATSTALLTNYFAEIGIKTSFHIPDRIKEGYGPNENALKKFKDEGVELCFLVDCGSVAHIPLAFAASINLDVIILDHHISSEILPQAIALINPNRFDQESTCTNLAAVGVVFLMLVALNTFLEEKNFFHSRKLKKPNLIKFLDLVALGSVCDVMEITRLNRVFVKKGLEILNNANNLGIRTLAQFLEIKEKIDTYHLGFMFGPRINAGGRIGNSSLGATLLTSNNIGTCYEISAQLNELNEKRKLIEENALKNAILKTYNFFSCEETAKKQSVIITSGDWHPGVSGIIASRIKDIYNLPSIAISFFENEDLGKASCRSISKIDIGAAIFAAKEKRIIESGGGHKMAAGFSIKKEKLDELREFLNNLFIEKINSCDSHLTLEFDDYIDLNLINIPFFNQLRILAPFGPGNPEPKFVIKNVKVYNSKIFASKHISCLLKSNSNQEKSIRALFFGNSVKNSGDILLKNPKQIDVLGSISLKNWNGREYFEFIIQDIINY